MGEKRIGLCLEDERRWRVFDGLKRWSEENNNADQFKEE